jgi:hypothetical protein
MESRNPKLHRSDMEMDMPPRWGFWSFRVVGYNDVGSSGATEEHFSRRSDSRLNSMAVVPALDEALKRWFLA